MNKLVSITFVALIGFMALMYLNGCKKDKPDSSNGNGTNNQNCNDIQNVKSYFAFKVGSWWLYEEENSGAIDSVYVTSYTNDPSSYNFDVRLYSTFQNYYYHFWPIFSIGGQGCQTNGEICSKCVLIKRSKYKPGNFVDEQDCFFFTAKIGDYETTYNTSFANNKIIIEDIYPNFSNANFEFGLTYKVHELNTFMEGKQATNHYFTENVGLIRKELIDSSQVWNLIDFHIEP